MIYLIILAAGQSCRFHQTQKCLQEIGQQPIFLYSIEAALEAKQIDQIILVVNKQSKTKYQKICAHLPIKIVLGGKYRNQSLFNGIKSIDNLKEKDIIISHDAARPLVNSQDFVKIIKQTKKNFYCSLGFYSPDSLVEFNEKKFSPLNRTKIIHLQTPQACLGEFFLNQKKYDFIHSTDLFSLLKLPISEKNIVLTNGNFNRKLTYDEDLTYFLKMID